MKTLFISENISYFKRKKLDGLYKSCSYISCYLIGQLSKNDLYKEYIKGKEIIDYAINIFEKTFEYLGGRFVLVECNENEKLLKFYNENQFQYLQKDENDNLVQLIRLL